jgi:hypothetical protein
MSLEHGYKDTISKFKSQAYNKQRKNGKQDKRHLQSKYRD